MSRSKMFYAAQLVMELLEESGNTEGLDAGLQGTKDFSPQRGEKVRESAKAGLATCRPAKIDAGSGEKGVANG